MAITENSFTQDELKAALEATPALLDVIKETAKGINVFVYKDTELNTFLEAKKQEYVNEATSKIYSQIDQDVIALTGATKGQEKTYEFVKRVISEHKTKQAQLETQIKNLDKQIKEGADVTLKTKYDALELEHNKLKNETIPSLNEKYFKAVVGAQIAEAQKDLTFNPAYDKEVIDTLIDVATQKMLSAAKAKEDGTIDFQDSEGRPFMNGIELAKPKDIFLKFLPSNIIDTGRQQPGGGTGKPGQATKHLNAEGKPIVISEDIKTKVQLHEFLRGQGLLATSKEFIEIDEQYKDLPVK